MNHLNVDRDKNEVCYFKIDNWFDAKWLNFAGKNQYRRITELGESAIFIWYSSNTIKNGQGCLMVYPVENKNAT